MIFQKTFTEMFYPSINYKLSLLVAWLTIMHVRHCMQVYCLMESIELVTRQHLHLKNIQVLSSGSNIQKLIMDDVLLSESVLACWEKVAYHIPVKYEPYSLELLRHITDLWIKIRGHSFTKDFTTKFVQRCSKGTRKGLKQMN